MRDDVTQCRPGRCRGEFGFGKEHEYPDHMTDLEVLAALRDLVAIYEDKTPMIGNISAGKLLETLTSVQKKLEGLAS